MTTNDPLGPSDADIVMERSNLNRIWDLHNYVTGEHVTLHAGLAVVATLRRWGVTDTAAMVRKARRYGRAGWWHNP